MPYTRKTTTVRRRPYKKRKYAKKKTKKYNNGITFLKLRSVSLLPDQMYVKLRYVESISKSGLNWSHVLTLNGLYDPNISGSGHQPMGFDQWISFYARYEVLGSSMNATVLNDTSVSFRASLYPSTSSTPLSAGDAREQPYALTRYVGHAAGGNGMVIFKKYMSMRKLEGRNTDSVNYTGNSAANPTDTNYWILNAAALDGVSMTTAFLDINLVYYVKFYDRHSLVGS